MLIRCAGSSVPCIIGDVDKEGGIVFCHGSGQRGKNDFITDQQTELVAAPRNRFSAFARVEISNAFHHFIKKRQPFMEGNIFSKWNQVRLVVPAVNGSFGADQIGTVIVFNVVSGGDKGRASDEKVRVNVMNRLLNHFRKRFVFQKIEGCRGFRPNKQIRIVLFC